MAENKTTLTKLKEREKHYMKMAQEFNTPHQSSIVGSIAKAHVIMYSELAQLTRILIEKEEKNNS